MISITRAVEDVLREDGFAREGLQRGVLNLSAYAKQILPRIEALTMKPVQIGSVIVALARVAKELEAAEPFAPYIHLSNLSVTSHLCEITYTKKDSIIKIIRSLDTTIFSSDDFFTLTEGLHEITIICTTSKKDAVLAQIPEAPKAQILDLVSVSVRFSDTYLSVPNTIYSLVSILATRHINILEIVSTYTELSFIINKNEMQQTVQALQAYTEQE